MSMVLSIYSHKGFREITLPERGANELQILLQKDLFALEKDIRLTAERSEGVWSVSIQDDTAFLRQGNRRTDTVVIKDGMKFEVDAAHGSCITVIAFQQSDPLTVYSKYSLTDIRQITVGRDEKNDICYKNDFVSGTHCAITFENGRAILNDSSTNGTYLNFRRVFGSTVLHYGDSIRIMRLNIIYLGNMIAIDTCDHLQVRALEPLDAEGLAALCGEPTGTGGVKVQYHRSPRNLRKLHTESFEIEAPPEQQPLREQPIAMMVGPALTMSIPMVLGSLLSVVASRSTGASAGAFMYMGMVTAIASALIGAVWALVNVRYARKQHKQVENQRFERYSEYLVRMRDRIERAYNENSEALKERYISGSECCALDEHSTILWNRNASYEDFLSVRLGLGDVPFQADILIPKERFTMFDDSLADKPAVIRQNFQTLKEVPVTVDLQKHRLIGITGGENRREAIAIAKAIMSQIAASNCYTEVKMGLVYDSGNDVDRGTWDFAMWLPHVWSSDKKIRYIATDRSEQGEVFYALTQILRNRSEEEEKTRNLKPRIVLFVTDTSLLDGEGISKYIFSREQDLGLTTVILAEKPEDLPNECECVIQNDGSFCGVYDTRDGQRYGTQVQFDRVSDESLWKFSRALGRIEVSESGQDGEIPNTLTFFDMYGIERPEELNAAERWRRSNSIASMRALVGFRNGNAPCYLDINEKYHGPHGLVAGTTGSGKSETLQTYILSLAVNFSPEDIGFFIIDYKGGGMANLFNGLPHLIGSISNLSGNQVNRAMVSIQSENRRRQRIFAEYGVNNINGYTALYKNGDAVEPIPHLFIIIDEFAELKREEPEFMKELISVAQVGRSLGVHLILSTQRPSGTVDENIWANSKFRLCLRVQDRQDSIDMLHRPEAAYLTQAGRCYLQVGNDEIFELFQSGWSGASYDEELGGGNLLIAQMLNATGKVDLVGNHAKLKRKEELRHRWVEQLLQIIESAQQQTRTSIASRDFVLTEQRAFLDAVYSGIHAIEPDFEQNQFNTARIGDLCKAYAGADKTRGSDALADSVIRSAARNGGRLPEVKGKTQLEAIVGYLDSVAQDVGVNNVRKLWLPVLPEYLYLDTLEAYTGNAFNGTDWPVKPQRFQLNAVIGMADDPENQAQFPVPVNFAEGGHHMLTGTVSTGKSTFLQTVIYSLAESYTPDILNIYCLDFSSKMLSVFADLKHVGGYMDEFDVENDQIGKFFTMITRILDERKKLFAGTSFEDYVNHNGWDIPAILIVIDNYGGFHEKTGETYEAIMLRLAKEGIGSGIFLLVTAGGISMQELPTRMAENFRTGLSLEMPDVFAYSDVLHVVRPSVLPESRVKGRGLMYYEDRVLEFQTALAAHAEGGPERNDMIKEDVARMNAAWKGPRARTVPRIPEKATRADFTALEEYQAALQNPHILPVGYDAECAEVYSFDLVKNYTFLITGTKSSGKTNLMENLMLTCAERGDKVLIVELEGSRFARTAEAHDLERCTDGGSLLAMFTDLQQEMVRRAPIKKRHLDAKSPEDVLFDAALENQRIDLFISDMQLLITELHDPDSLAFNALAFFDTLCERGKGYNIFVYAEMADRDQDELMGYACVDSMRNYQSGIRFGGKFGDQKLLPFENVRYQDQDRSMKAGIGVLPSDDSEASLVRVVIPLA